MRQMCEFENKYSENQSGQCTVLIEIQRHLSIATLGTARMVMPSRGVGNKKLRSFQIECFCRSIESETILTYLASNNKSKRIQNMMELSDEDRSSLSVWLLCLKTA